MRARPGRRATGSRSRCCAPREVELPTGLVAEPLAGRGAAVPDAVDPATHDQRHAHCDVLVVGGGAGRAARPPRAAASGGARVDPGRGRAGARRASRSRRRRELTVLDPHDRGRRLRRRLRRAADGRPRARAGWRRARAVRRAPVILATGAVERTDRLRRQRPPGRDARGRRARLRRALRRRAGTTRRGLHHRRLRARGGAAALAAAGHRRRAGRRRRATARWSAAAEGDAALAAVTRPRGRRGRTVACDLLAVAGGWTRRSSCWTQAQGTLRWDDAAGRVPARRRARALGGRGRRRPAPATPTPCVRRHRRGAAAAQATGFAASRNGHVAAAAARGAAAAARLLPASPRRRGGTSDYVDLQRDATVADLRTRGRRRAALARARQALHDDRDGDRPGPHLRRPRRSACSPSCSAPAVGGARARRPPAAVRPVSLRAARRPRPRRALRPRAHDADARLARRARRRLRGRRAVEAARGTTRRAARTWTPPAARVPRRARARGDDGRLDARQDRRAGPRRGRVPGPPVHERLRQARRRPLQVRADVHGGRDGVRRRRTMRLDERPLPRDHDHGQRRRRARLVRGVAADGVARAARALHVGHRAVGDGRRRRPALARRAGRARAGPRRRAPRTSASWTIREARRRGDRRAGRAAISFSGELAYEVNVPGGTRPRAVGGRLGGRRAVRHHAVRDRDDARAARGEGLRDRRPGDRRHGHAAGPRAGLDDRQGQARLRRPALAPAHRRDARRTASSSSALLPVRAAAEGAQLVLDASGPVPMLGHVTSSYDSAALGRPFALALLARRPRAPRRDGARAARRPDGRRRRSPTPCSTTRGARGATARSPLADRAAELAAAPVPLRELGCSPRSACGCTTPRRAAAPRGLGRGRRRASPPRSASRCPACRTPRPRRDARRALWLGPDEWLVVGPPATRRRWRRCSPRRSRASSARPSGCARTAPCSSCAARPRATCSPRAARSTCTRARSARAPARRRCSAARRCSSSRPTREPVYRHPRPRVVRRLPGRLAAGRRGGRHREPTFSSIRRRQRSVRPTSLNVYRWKPAMSAAGSA